MSSSYQKLLLKLENLRQELDKVKTELDEVKEEKVALEILLETSNAHHDAIEEDLVSEREEKSALETFLEITNEHTDAIEEDLVRENERKIASFMEAIPVGVLVLDAKGKIDFCNQKALQLLAEESVPDVTAEQLSEIYQLQVMETEQLYPISNLPSVRALKGESSSVEDIEIHYPDGKITPLEVQGVPIYDKKCQITHAITVFQDITGRKQAEAERERFTRELETLNASLEKRVAERTVELQQANKLIRQVFGRYLSNEIVDTLLETESGLTLGGERREITILTSDIRGFTAQANKLPPEQVVKIINFYLKAMADVITEYQGTIDEFMGDGILVLFGAPIVRADDPERAVACAVAMQLAMSKVNEQIQAWGYTPLEMGIGVNTGDVVVGNIGSEKRTKYGVIGNEVNLTYRIESYTTGGQIFISEPTLKKVGDLVKIQSEKQVKPKGIKQPITFYEVEGIGGKYNFYLSKEEEEFFPLWEEIPLQYTVLEGKHLSDQVLSGHLLKLSAKRALIRCQVEKEFIPEPLNNLKINFLKPNQSGASEDLYAKVLKQGPQENSLYIHFTSLSTAIYQIGWTPALSVNHPIIDEQHQQLFTKFETLRNYADRGKKADVAETIRFLETYAITHFGTEEQLMKQHGYPDTAVHQAQHAKFIDNLNDFKKEFQTNPGGHLYLVLKIQQKLVDWFIHHIGQSDQQLGVFLQDKTLQTKG
jgi:hemerythrin-like metal-binding protein/PAS domain S-box-containing protein